MITKELFIRAMNEIVKEREKIEKFNDALGLVCNGFPVVELGNGYLDALLGILNAYFAEEDDEYPTVEWWLFEDCEKKIWIYSGEEKLELDVSEAGDLYDSLMIQKERKCKNGN